MYYNEAVQIVLRKWQSLPASTSASHIPLFQRFQNIVELQESIIIMSKLQKTKRTHGNAHPHQMPDLTTHLHVWKKSACQMTGKTRQFGPTFYRGGCTCLILSKLKIKLEMDDNHLNKTIERTKIQKVQDEPWTLLQLCTVAQKQKLDGFILSLPRQIITNSKDGIGRSL